jgi:hypothetical protein
MNIINILEKFLIFDFEMILLDYVNLFLFRLRIKIGELDFRRAVPVVCYLISKVLHVFKILSNLYGGRGAIC